MPKALFTSNQTLSSHLQRHMASGEPKPGVYDSERANISDPVRFKGDLDRVHVLGPYSITFLGREP